jgi:hypothetical protein
MSLHNRPLTTGWQNNNRRRTSPRTSPRANLLVHSGTGGSNQGTTSKQRRDGRQQRRRALRNRSRLIWVAALVFFWAFGPLLHKVIQGFNKVYMRRWFYPIDRPYPCQPTSLAPPELIDNKPLPSLLPADMTNLPGLRPKKLRIGIISLCDDGVEAICETSTANKQAYADLHGYDLIVDEEIVDKNRPTSWSKLLAMRKYLPEYDFLLYVDIDIVIMNPNRRLEDIVDYNYDQMLAADANGMNCGVWMIRNTPWSLWFIDEMWAQDQFVAPKAWNMLFKYEQRAFHFLYQSPIWRRVIKGDQYPKANTVRARTKVLNACVFNSQPAFYTKGDLLVHLAGLKGFVKCMGFRHYYKEARETMKAMGPISADADIAAPSIWRCMTKRT